MSRCLGKYGRMIPRLKDLVDWVARLFQRQLAHFLFHGSQNRVVPDKGGDLVDVGIKGPIVFEVGDMIPNDVVRDASAFSGL